jgi:CHAT domain-containing protein/Tfp pilus assembly protein PilF
MIEGSKSHCYKLKLNKGDFMRLSVVQLGIDVELSLYSPSQKLICDKVDTPTGRAQAEPLSEVVKETGDYILLVRALDENPGPGRYQVVLTKPRRAEPEDETFVQAERAYVKGWTMVESGGDFENGIKNLKYALDNVKILDPSKETLILLEIGTGYLRLRKHEDAITYFNRLISIKPVPPLIVAQAFVELGQAFLELRDRSKAHSAISEAMGIIRQLQLEVRLNLIKNIGDIYYERGYPKDAIPYYAAIVDQLANQERTRPIRETIAEALDNVGKCHWALHDMDSALEFYNKAYDLEREGESLSEEPVTLNNIGMVYLSTGQLETAIEYFDRQLKLTRDIPAQSKSSVVLEGEVWGLINKGYALALLGKSSDAEKLYNEALPLAQEFVRAFPQNVVKNPVGYIYHNLASLYFDSGEKEKSLENLHRALKLRQNVEPIEEATTLANIGRILTEKGDYDSAIKDYFDKALDIQQRGGVRGDFAYTSLFKAQALNGKGYYKEATDILENTLRLHRDLRDARGQASTLFLWATFDHSRKEFEQSLNHIRAARHLIESARSGISDSELRLTYFSTAQGFYDLEIDNLFHLYAGNRSSSHIENAFDVHEGSRARVLNELLAQSRAIESLGIDKALLDKQSTLKRRIRAYKAALSASGAQGAEETRQKLELSEKGLADNTADILRRYPKFKDLTEPATLSDIQNHLDANTLLLEYRLSDERSYLWTVTSRSIRGHILAFKRAEIENEARTFYELVTAPDPCKYNSLKERNEKVAEAAQKLTQSAKKLSAMLLSPVKSNIGNKRLVIVADGALQYIPFSALANPTESMRANDRRRTTTLSYQPLVLSHEIVSLPSASTVVVLREGAPERVRAEKGVAVFADPVFDQSDDRLKKGLNTRPEGRVVDRIKGQGDEARFDTTVRELCPKNGKLQSLPFSRTEAEAIIDATADPSNLKATDFDASKAVALSEDIMHYRMVHFATHGVLDSANPDLSALVLSLIDKNGNSQDGYVRLRDIYKMRLRAELVVLSACRTALGKEIRGEGIVGLTRGFMHAGANRVVASLWTINDEPTAEFMKAFYTQMKGRPAAAALRQAQIAMVKSRDWQSPYNWAAFVFQGDWK